MSVTTDDHSNRWSAAPSNGWDTDGHSVRRSGWPFASQSLVEAADQESKWVSTLPFVRANRQIECRAACRPAGGLGHPSSPFPRPTDVQMLDNPVRYNYSLVQALNVASDHSIIITLQLDGNRLLGFSNWTCIKGDIFLSRIGTPGGSLCSVLSHENAFFYPS
jgi:hypothetical protein